MSDEMPTSRLDYLAESVRQVLEWKLPAARWQRVDEALTALAAALDSGADDELSEAADLLAASPGRVTKIGSESPVPPPEPVRERTTELVHRLDRVIEQSGRSDRPGTTGNPGSPPGSGTV